MLSWRFTSCLSRSTIIHRYSKNLLARTYSCTPSLYLDKKYLTNTTSTQLQASSVPGLTKEDLKLLLEPYVYHSSIPIKASRSIMINGFNYWLKLPSDLCARIEHVIHMIYHCVYMLDDVEDGSAFRRGLPAAHRLYGTPRTSICGRVGYNLAIKELIEMGNMKAIEVINDEHIIHHTGISKEIYLRERQLCPTFDEFELICSQKSTPAINMIVKLMQAFSDCQTDFTRLADLFGLYYQYINDTSNMSDEKIWDAKGFCDDLVEAKYTLPLIHAIRSGTPEGEIVAAILRQPEKDLPTIKYCLSLLDKLGSIEFSKNLVLKIEKDLRQEIQNFGGNPGLLEYIDAVKDWKYDEKFEESYPKAHYDKMVNV